LPVDYRTLDLEDETSKPTDKEMIRNWEDTYETRQFRRRYATDLLKECDHCALPNFPNRDQWLVYRQQLRDLPVDWTTDTPFPETPT
jgi:hypothetical protein